MDVKLNINTEQEGGNRLWDWFSSMVFVKVYIPNLSAEAKADLKEEVIDMLRLAHRRALLQGGHKELSKGVQRVVAALGITKEDYQDDATASVA